MPSWKKVITSGSNASLNSLYVTNGITGSLLGTASYAITSSYGLNPTISGSINNVNYIDFNTSASIPPYQNGRIFWDNTEGALSVYNSEADVTLQVGQENWTRVYNDTVATIANGAPVRITGTHGDHPEVVLAASIQVSGSSNLVNQILGLATHAIEAGTFGYVTTQGLVRGVNTSAFNDGDTLYLSSSAGQLTNIIPTSPYEIVPIGQVVKASPGGSGIIYVAVQQPLDFTDLSSVALGLGTYQDGDIWTYYGPTKQWRHQKFLTGSYVITGSLTISGSSTFTNVGRAIFSGSVISTGGFTGSLSGTAATASYVNTLNQTVIITSSAAIGTSSLGPSENTLTLGARDTSNEGGQIGFNAPGGTYTSASFIDNWQNKARILKGNNTTSTGLIAQWDIHTTQMQLPGYTAASSFPGTATANLAVDSGGNVITVSTSGGTVFPYTGNAVITGSLTATTGFIAPNTNGAMYLRGGDDVELWDINISNHLGVYGQQDSTVASIKLGSGGGVISGKSGNIGIGTINPTSASLQVNGNVWANSFTGSLQGTATTASYVLNAVSSSFASTASYVVTAQTASYVLNAVSASYATQALSSSFATTASYATQALSASYAPTTLTFPYTGDAQISGSLGVTGSFGIQTYDAFMSSAFVNAIQITNTSRNIYDIFGTDSIDAGARFLKDNTGGPSLGWLSRTMFDSATAQSIDWQNRIAYDASGTTYAIDWNNRFVVDGTGISSIVWGSRELNDSTGNAVITWNHLAQAQAVEINSYTRKILPLATIVESFSNLPVYASFNPDGEILNGVALDSSVANFDLVYLNTDNKWYPVVVSTSSSSKLLGIAWGVGTGKEKVFIEGTMVVALASSGATDAPLVDGIDHGLPIYIKTGGGIFMAAGPPGSAGDYVRVLGHAYYQGTAASDYWVMKFRPSNDWYVI